MSEATSADAAHGFRLERVEVYNWGTFDKRVWALHPRGENALLTGDIGSGKSTLVDAITTLLVPPQRLAYNKAAEAETRERTLRSYVLGYYKKERGEAGLSARPVALRDHNSYSVILAVFFHRGFEQRVTLAQVFWLKDPDVQPERLFVVAEGALSIAEHFAGFGTEIGSLKKRLRRDARLDVRDSFPPYGAAFRRRFGIENEQALDLFHQTVSMKSVGNLTDFVRQHMLEPFPVENRVQALIGHYEDLSRAHDAVLKAKAQIARLTPLVEDCRRHAGLTSEVKELRDCRDALATWFTGLKAGLLRERIALLEREIEGLSTRIDTQEEQLRSLRSKRDELKSAISANGGDRIERIAIEIERKEEERRERAKRADRYSELARAVDLPAVTNVESFALNARALVEERQKTKDDDARIQNQLTEDTVAMKTLRRAHAEIASELDSLRSRRSNITANMLVLRSHLCTATGIDEGDLPFAGELLQVREEARDWEGAIERLLHGFGLSLLVGETHYAQVASWVDRTHLGGRLVYYRVREPRPASLPETHPRSLVRKVAVKPDSNFYGWLEAEIARRFDYACADTIDQFRREARAITRAGQIKGSGERHEKDDRHRIDDRSGYVLGWSNEAKIGAFEKQAEDLERRIHKYAQSIGELTAARSAKGERLTSLDQLAVFESFREIDWRPLVLEIEELAREKRALEASSDILSSLGKQLAAVEAQIEEVVADLRRNTEANAAADVKRKQDIREQDACEQIFGSASEVVTTTVFPKLDARRREAIGERVLTVETCQRREADFREWLQDRIDIVDNKIRRLSEKIVGEMARYREDYPIETQEVDASMGAAAEFAKMLDRLSTDDLPRFEGRFKELLNENTIREVANFQSQLNRERQTIRERIEIINRSLHAIDYNPGRYIVLDDAPSTDAEIRDFQQDLRACTEGALTGSDDESYSEAKFVQVQRIIERLRGREGTAEIDRRWTRKVTDVRNWFIFSATERWREDGREHEHYPDSGGKSGGQKEKLAYTVLAASLAYQFGLESGAPDSRTFRFVVIDEAFGRGSDESARFGLELFQRLGLQLLIVTPLQKIHIIEPYVASVGFVHNEEGRLSMLRNLTIEEYRAERAARAGSAEP